MCLIGRDDRTGSRPGDEIGTGTDVYLRSPLGEVDERQSVGEQIARFFVKKIVFVADFIDIRAHGVGDDFLHFLELYPVGRTEVIYPEGRVKKHTPRIVGRLIGRKKGRIGDGSATTNAPLKGDRTGVSRTVKVRFLISFVVRSSMVFSSHIIAYHISS